MKILFWFNGSGGQRRERKVVDYNSYVTTPEESHLIEDRIKDDLDAWKDSLMSNSEFQRWGWTDDFNEEKLEPNPEKKKTVFHPNNRIHPEPDKWYWAWYECRMAIVHASLCGYGFFAFGQEPLWRWDNAEVLAEALPPQIVTDELGKYPNS